MFHAIQGERGFFAWVQAKQQIEYATARLDETKNDRQTWERRIAFLRDDNLDPDLLDEQVRRMTGLGNPREIVIFDTGPAPAKK